MHKSIVFSLLIFSFLFCFQTNSIDSIQQARAANINLTATPTPDAANDSFNVKLDRYTFIIPCPPGYRCSHSDADSAPFIVTVSNTKPEDYSLRYKYTTSGGRVIGEGSKISWDFPNAQPGTYTITVVVMDKAGNELQTTTKTITVEGYEDDYHRCLGACPILSVDAPSEPTPAGDAMTFTANVEYGTVENMTYNWTVTGGKIIAGQGTPTIKVATTRKMVGKTIEATAEFKWDHYCWDTCNKTASASRQVAAKKYKDK